MLNIVGLLNILLRLLHELLYLTAGRRGDRPVCTELTSTIMGVVGVRSALLIACAVAAVVGVMVWSSSVEPTYADTRLEVSDLSVPPSPLEPLDAHEQHEAQPTDAKPSVGSEVHRSCSIEALKVVPREEADAIHCRRLSGVTGTNQNSCTSWTRFPPSTSNTSCEFLCTQSSEVRPAIWKHSALRISAIVAAGRDDGTEDAACRTPLVPPAPCLLGGQQEPAPSILFIGHSHTRYLVSMLCMMLNATSCKQLDDQFRNISIVRAGDVTLQEQFSGDPSFVRLVFVQANYHFGTKLGLLKEALTPTELRSITHVVFSRGSWDLLFYDRDPLEIVEDLTSSLDTLFRALSPSVVKILHMPHFVHAKPATGLKKRAGGPSHAAVRASWRRLCFATHRLERMRDVNLCAAYHASSAAPHASSVLLYDTYAATRSQLAFRFVDELGHHYQDVMLEYLAMVFLGRFVCPAEAPSASLLLRNDTATAACSRVGLAGGANFRVVPDCACHHPTERRDGICKRFGRSVPDMARRV